MDSTLLRILTRSAFKTSPFSSFTSIEFKKISEEKAEGQTIQSEYSIELNYYILQKILQLISVDPEFMPHLKYAYSGSSYENGEVVEFTVRYDINRGKIFNNIENHFLAKNNPIFQALSIFNGVLSYHEVLEVLLRFTDKQKAQTFFVDGLIKKGILYPNIELDEYSPNILKSFYQIVKGFDFVSAKKDVIIETLDNITILLEKYKIAGSQKRFGLYSEIIDELSKIEKEFNYTFTKENIFYEDYVVSQSGEEFVPEEDFQSDVHYVQKLAVLTNIPLQFKYEFAHRFQERYSGSLRPIGSKEIRDLYMEEVMKFTNWTNVILPVEGLVSNGARVLEEIKGELRQMFRHLKSESGTAAIPKETVDELYRKFILQTGFDKKHLSSTFLFQKCGDSYILNKLYAGHLKLFIRYFQYLPELYDDPDFKQYISDSFPEDIYEIREGFGFNANYHRKFLKNRLLIPYSKVNADDEGTSWSKDLLYKYNNRTQLVDIINPDNPDIPMDIDYIGSLVDYMMPPSIRMLTTSIAPRFDAGLFLLWEEDAMDQGALVEDHTPRMKLGKVVLFREKWLINCSGLISDSVNSSYKEYMEVIEKFEQHGLPMEFFINRIVDPESYDFENSNRSDMKPQYINLYSPMMFREFKKFIKAEKRVVIEELFPNGSGDAFNTEYQLEVNMPNE
ncbi:lantibiotic dehydratase [Bacillus sp. P14.5]|uniref:lantibiotic dehydratase n=1 Tax=Bacillus sp. P14.5 TaxID=1983400 RepID=UPI000DE81ABB|nr:lantibiotic dehydratase [Bacillus sp. P14.5]